MLVRSPNHDRPRVLVVDDERVIADTLSRILALNGFEVSTAYSGEKAIEAARFWHPDILLADVIMPGLNGVEAATRIRAFCPACRILLLTGQAGIAERHDPSLPPGNDFEIIAKPIHPTQLVELLRSSQWL